ncbi:hypothetical protein A6S26_27475 [Nostoc sp. ATCC 43529]|nr:hypothetical protein A6S26_27475 [Nostoc sp. ATCC 43529]
MRLTGIFLDFDGVISPNSVGLMHKWVYEYINKFTSVPIRERTIKEIAKLTTTFPPKAVLELVFQSFGIPLDVKQVQQLMHKEISDSVAIDPGFSRLLNFCSQNDIQVKIISQRSSTSGAFNQLEHVPGLDASMVCSTQGMSKADPACYIQIGSNLQLDLKDWIIVDDSPYALRAAKIANLKTGLMVTPTFNIDDYLEYEDLIDIKLSSLDNLSNIVKSKNLCSLDA